jgi:hypothetical protein
MSAQDLKTALLALISRDLASFCPAAAGSAKSVDEASSPEDLITAARAAAEPSGASLPPGSPRVDLVLGLAVGLEALWQGLAALPSLPSVSELRSSRSFETLSGLVSSFGYFPTQLNQLHEDWSDQAVFCLAVNAVACKDQRPEMVDLIRWFGFDVCEKQWRITDVWKSPGESSAIFTCVAKEDHALLSAAELASSLCAKDLQRAALFAFKEEFTGLETLSVLLDLGLDVSGPSSGLSNCPLICNFVLMVKEDSPKWQYDKLQLVLDKRPDAAKATWTSAGGTEITLPVMAIDLGNPKLLSFLLSRGAPEGSELPLLLVALKADQPRYDIVEVLLKDYSGSASWLERHGEHELRLLADFVAKLAISSYPASESYSEGTERYAYCPENLRMLKLILQKGFRWSWSPQHYNALLDRLFCRGATRPSKRRVPIDEADVLSLLRLYRAHGLEIREYEEPSGTHDNAENRRRRSRRPLTLPFLAAGTSQASVLQLCLDELGCSIEDYADESTIGQPRITILWAAFQDPLGQDIARLALAKGASGFRPDLEDHEQPLIALLMGSYSDEEALPFVKEIIQRYPDILQWPGWHKPGADDPIGACCLGPSRCKPKCLELILRSNLPGTMELIRHHPVSFCLESSPVEMPLVPFLSASWNWPCLSLLLEHSELRVTEAIRGKRTIETDVLSSVGAEGDKAPPAALVDLVKTKAAQERGAGLQVAQTDEPSVAKEESDEEEISDPFLRAVSKSDNGLVRRWVVFRGLDLSDNSEDTPVSALSLSFNNGLVETFELLVELGASLLSPCGNGNPFYAGALASMEESCEPKLKAKKFRMLQFMAQQPEVTSHSFVQDGERYAWDMFSYAIMLKDVAVVEALLQAGFPLRCDHQEGVMIDGHRVEVMSTLEAALNHGYVPVVEALIRGGALVEWRTRYTDAAKRALGILLVAAAVGSYPVQPRYRGPVETNHSPTMHTQMFDILSGAGFDYVWNDRGGNRLFTLLSARAAELFGFRISEGNMVRLLKRWKAAGLSLQPSREATDEVDEKPMLLQHYAANANLPLVLDLALSTEFGGDVEAIYGKERADSLGPGRHTMLFDALNNRSYKAIATLLLEKHGAKVFRLDLRPIEQPLTSLLAGDYSDLDSLHFLKLLLQREPRMLEWEGWRNPGIANPLLYCVTSKKLKCLTFFLQTGAALVQELVQRSCPMYTSNDASRRRFDLSPASYCAVNGLWEYLAVLLQYNAVRVTGGDVPIEPLVIRSASRPGPQAPPRSLVAALKAQAAKEREEARLSASKAKGNAASDVPSNAFELPAPKILTERDEKKKAKKAAAKKKAKAKKREAAKAANAGAGSAKAADGDDTDSSGSEEESEEEVEPGTEHLVDSRNAPDLTVMLAARRAARAKEEAETAAAAEAERASSEKKKEE